MNVAKPPCTHSVVRAIEGGVSMMGLVLNIVLSFLIIFRTEKELRLYGRVLLFGSVLNAVFSLSTFTFGIVSIELKPKARAGLVEAQNGTDAYGLWFLSRTLCIAKLAGMS